MSVLTTPDCPQEHRAADCDLCNQFKRLSFCPFPWRNRLITLLESKCFFLMFSDWEKYIQYITILGMLSVCSCCQLVMWDQFQFFQFPIF